jgi:hypothetical protein
MVIKLPYIVIELPYIVTFQKRILKVYSETFGNESKSCIKSKLASNEKLALNQKLELNYRTLCQRALWDLSKGKTYIKLPHSVPKGKRKTCINFFLKILDIEDIYANYSRNTLPQRMYKLLLTGHNFKISAE